MRMLGAAVLFAALASTAFTQGLAGRRAPGFYLHDANLVYYDLRDFQGQWLILDFTKPICVPCTALSKNLDEVKARYGSRIEILAVLGPPESTMSTVAYVAQTHPTYPVVYDSIRETGVVAGADSPHWLAIDPSGVIAYEWTQYPDGKEWVQQLDRLMACARPGIQITCPPLTEASAVPATADVNALHRAARTGSLSDVQALIGEGTPVDARDSLGGTPLHDAAWSGEAEVATYLIAMGADVNAKHNEGGSTPLHYAVLTNHPEVAEVLLNHGADVKAPYKTSQTPLHLAASRGYGRIAAMLIAHGADVNARDATGATPLSEAAWTGEAEMVRLLLSKGASASEANPDTGMTPLHAAASRGYKEVAKALIEAGARADVKDKSGATPLYLALQFQRMDVVDLLVRDRQGNLPKPQSIDAKAVLRDEVLRGRTNVVAMLLDLMPPLGSTTLLHDAALKGHIDVIELLLAHGADINSKNAQGGTALHDAALAGQAEAVEALIKHGCDVNARDADSGATPLHHAASWGRKNVVEMLLANHADRTIKDKNGRTPLDLAIANGQDATAAVLKRTP